MYCGLLAEILLQDPLGFWAAVVMASSIVPMIYISTAAVALLMPAKWNSG
jgi:hypothetical protein